MKSLSRAFLSSLLFISSFALAAPSSPNANIEKQIDAQQQKQQAEQDAAILAQQTQSANVRLEGEKKRHLVFLRMRRNVFLSINWC